MKTLLIVALVVALPATASAHTTDELDDWQEGWWATFTKTGMTIELAEEWTEVMSRHLEYAGKVPEPEPRDARETAGAISRYVNRGMGSSVEQWRGLVSGYFGGETDLALCVMLHESGGNPNARNPSSGAAGLFQVMPFWWDHFGGDRYDPTTNVAVAKKIRDMQGWSAWSAYNRGKC